MLAAFRRAEEVENGRPDVSLDLYRAAGQMATTLAVRAFAMARAARCLAKMKRHARSPGRLPCCSRKIESGPARPVRWPLRARCGDRGQRNRKESGRRRGTAAVAAACASFSRRSVVPLFDQAEFFDDRLREGAQPAAEERARSALFDQLTLARTISERFQHHGVFRPNAVYANALANGSGLSCAGVLHVPGPGGRRANGPGPVGKPADGAGRTGPADRARYRRGGPVHDRRAFLQADGGCRLGC